MFFSDTPALTFLLLMLPAIINLWANWHAANHRFEQEKERTLWILAGIFLPVAGGLCYLIFGLRRSRPLH